jgi:hypothetical protein
LISPNFISGRTLKESTRAVGAKRREADLFNRDTDVVNE